MGVVRGGGGEGRGAEVRVVKEVASEGMYYEYVGTNPAFC